MFISIIKPGRRDWKSLFQHFCSDIAVCDCFTGIPAGSNYIARQVTAQLDQLSPYFFE
jgi:hypothetical protein